MNNTLLKIIALEFLKDSIDNAQDNIKGFTYDKAIKYLKDNGVHYVSGLNFSQAELYKTLDKMIEEKNELFAYLTKQIKYNKLDLID